VGVSQDERNQRVAAERAALLGVRDIDFPIQDLRTLDGRSGYLNTFDVAICFEAVEHILDDRKLFRDIAACLKPGGMVLLTTPNYFYRAITPGDDGPYARTEDGGHVRRGYTAPMLCELCKESGLVPAEISYCSGLLSQKVCYLMRLLSRPFLLGWALTLPLRVLPILFDRAIGRLSSWPYFSICLVAYKPRFGSAGAASPLR